MISTELIPANGINLNVAFAGPENGKPVILLHGFPDFWFCWESQMKALAEKGFRVIAPDQRGFNLSDKPLGVEAYSQKSLAADIIGLADTLGIDKFYLAGHDFGGLVSWSLATLYPERIKKMVVLSAPHLLASVEYGKTNISQKLKSWYVLFFQLAYLPEKLIALFDYALLVKNLPGSLLESQIERYKTAWKQPEGMKSMINWYRALLKGVKERSVEYGMINIPTHILWGDEDKYLEAGLADLSLRQCTEGKMTIFEHCSHWLMHDKSEEVSKILIKNFSD